MSAPDRMQSTLHKHNDNERITPAALNRIGLLGLRTLWATVANLMVRKDNGAHLVGTEKAFVGDGCKVVHVSGNLSTGVTFRVQAGFAVQRAAGVGAQVEDSAHDVYEPLVVQAPFTFVTNASDVLHPRLDSVYLKRSLVANNPQSVDLIDPATKNITASSLDTEWDADTKASVGFAYVVGTPAASPVEPGVPVGFVAADKVATIRIDPGSGSFNTANLTDRRILFELHPSATPGLGAIHADDILVDSPLADAHVQEALERLTTDLGTLSAAAVRGLTHHGGLVYTDTATVTLRRGAGRGGTNAEIAIELDGVVYTKTDADLAFSMVSHIEGTEAASTWYYLYVHPSGGSLVPHISATAPVLPGGAGKVGYHPTNTGWRYLGSLAAPALGAIYNDASQNVMRWNAVGDEWTLAAGIPSTWVLTPANPALGGNFAAVSLASIVPPCAREALIRARAVASDNSGTHIYFGAGALIGSAVVATGTELKTTAQGVDSSGDAAGAGAAMGTFWMGLDASRQIAIGRALGAPAANPLGIQIAVIGWR